MCVSSRSYVCERFVGLERRAHLLAEIVVESDPVALRGTRHTHKYTQNARTDIHVRRVRDDLMRLRLFTYAYDFADCALRNIV